MKTLIFVLFIIMLIPLVGCGYQPSSVQASPESSLEARIADLETRLTKMEAIITGNWSYKVGSPEWWELQQPASGESFEARLRRIEDKLGIKSISLP